MPAANHVLLRAQATPTASLPALRSQLKDDPSWPLQWDRTQVLGTNEDDTQSSFDPNNICKTTLSWHQRSKYRRSC